MAVKLGYIIEAVEDMARAVKFYRDVVDVPLKFQSEGRSEFSTGETVRALYVASEKNPSGRVELAFLADDLQKFYQVNDRARREILDSADEAGLWRDGSRNS